MTRAFDLIETMRYDRGLPLLERHLSRLERSATAFAIPFDEERIRDQIDAVCSSLDDGKPSRVRLVLNAAGLPAASAAPLVALEGDLAVAFSTTRLDSTDTYLYHKTTHRVTYDREWAAAQQKGLFEVLYFNESGHVAEGSRTNIFVRLGELMATPPVDAGLLPGVYRSVVLNSFPDTAEKSLTEADIRRADAVFVCNAVIGLRRVRLIDSHG